MLALSVKKKKKKKDYQNPPFLASLIHCCVVYKCSSDDLSLACAGEESFLHETVAQPLLAIRPLLELSWISRPVWKSWPRSIYNLCNPFSGFKTEFLMSGSFWLQHWPWWETWGISHNLFQSVLLKRGTGSRDLQWLYWIRGSRLLSICNCQAQGISEK